MPPQETGDDETGDDETGDTGPGSVQDAEQMCARWTADRAELAEGTWSGDVATCDAGEIGEPARANALRLINLYRALAGLPAVTDDPGLNTAAQDCALMMHANGMLSHDPPQSWACFTASGAESAGTSNISGGRLVESVDAYMIDWGNETTLGHRRWILSGTLGPVGLGSTDQNSCMTVVGGSGTFETAWTAFPPPGPFPYQAFDLSRFSDELDQTGWSLQSETLDLDVAQVSITVDGEDRPVAVTPLAPGVGSASAISMIAQGWTAQPGTTYHVEVSGVGMPIGYDVEIVDCG
ncbi:MAG: CAP domain-containing protein [Myxococcota bacterium]